jgi:hypothetical protein
VPRATYRLAAGRDLLFIAEYTRERWVRGSPTAIWQISKIAARCWRIARNLAEAVVTSGQGCAGWKRAVTSFSISRSVKEFVFRACCTRAWCRSGTCSKPFVHLREVIVNGLPVNPSFLGFGYPDKVTDLYRGTPAGRRPRMRLPRGCRPLLNVLGIDPTEKWSLKRACNRQNNDFAGVKFHGCLQRTRNGRN